MLTVTVEKPVVKIETQQFCVDLPMRFAVISIGPPERIEAMFASESCAQAFVDGMHKVYGDDKVWFEVRKILSFE